MTILAIDPGNVQSAYVLIDDGFRLGAHGKVDNYKLLGCLKEFAKCCDRVVIERIASYGMAVGRTVFETCEWIGRFTQAAAQHKVRTEYVFRMEEKMTLCHSAKAGDANIRRALIDRFARHDMRTGKGTKKNPDYFYDFAKDEWAAMAVAVAYLDRQAKQ